MGPLKFSSYPNFFPVCMCAGHMQMWDQSSSGNGLTVQHFQPHSSTALQQPFIACCDHFELTFFTISLVIDLLLVIFSTAATEKSSSHS